MRVLVGMPVYKLEGSVRMTLDSMIESPADLLVIDNNSADDVKARINTYGNRIKVITNDTNRGCNGAWNQILCYGILNEYDIIGLQTDTILKLNWYEPMVEYLSTHSREVVIAAIGDVRPPNHTFEVSGAPLSFFPREAAEIVYPIPATLTHWFGDTYMFVKLRRLGWKMTVVGAVGAWHSWSEVTVASPEINPVIASDKAEWRRLFPEIKFE